MNMNLITGPWTMDIPMIVVAMVLLVFHFITNGNRLTQGTWIFGCGLILLLLVTLSPLAYIGHHQLMSAHMAQHIVILLIIPPMLIRGTSPEFLERIMKNRSIRNAGNIIFYPVIAWLLGMGAMWFWHIPFIFSAVIHSGWLHFIHLFSLLILGIIFIWPVYTPVQWRKLSPLTSVLYLFTACVGCTLLGIMISFSPDMIYTGAYSSIPAGVSPASDQQIAGLIMWVPACVVYITYIMIILGKWFGPAQMEGTLKRTGNSDNTRI